MRTENLAKKNYVDYFAHAQVIIAGAGPGDPSLLTVQVMHACQKAEVILVDRLVHPEIVQQYTSKKAKIIGVGKAVNQKNSMPQDEICKKLVDFAQQGLKTLRLKGGDVSFYSNVWDEIRILRKFQISYRLMPGISAMSGAATAMGIPLTARNYSSSVEVILYAQEKDIKNREQIAKRIATSETTFAIYMGLSKLGELLTFLQIYTHDKNKVLAVIERATTSSQQIKIMRLHEGIPKNLASIQGPGLILSGKVLELYRGLPKNLKNEPEFLEL